MHHAVRHQDHGFLEKYPHLTIYEPELHPAVTFRNKELRATFKVFSTGNITVTAPSVDAVQGAVGCIFPLVQEFRKERTAADLEQMAATRHRRPSTDSSYLQQDRGSDFD